jgi:hypothetical protein
MKTQLTIAAALLLCATTAQAQEPPASQHATVSQTINKTVVTVTYDRPVARGRALFGDDALVKYGAVWTAGANRATIVELSTPARIAGQDVPAGKYSLWTIPGPNEWTFILSRRWDAHHSQYPGERQDLFRVTLQPQSAPHLEVLAYYFPLVGPYHATLHLHWGEVVLAIPIEVER